MSYSSLIDFYRNQFAMVQHHKYSLADLENMYPFERDIYIDLLGEYLDEVDKKTRD